MQLLNGDRVRNIRYVFRHAEAAGIMIVLSNQSYVGHVEHAWNTVLKASLGIMHITQDVCLPPTPFLALISTIPPVLSFCIQKPCAISVHLSSLYSS